MKCKKCGAAGRPLFRDRPKGQAANFVCRQCLPDGATQPDEETVSIAYLAQEAIDG